MLKVLKFNEIPEFLSSFLITLYFPKSKKYVKKHQNKTIEDYGFTKKQILNDFDFVYQEYFV